MKAVEWFGKKWPLDLEMQDKIRAHVNELPDEKRDDYIKYLTGFCEFKMNFNKGD